MNNLFAILAVLELYLRLWCERMLRLFFYNCLYFKLFIYNYVFGDKRIKMNKINKFNICISIF